jgi:hypothetical protein
MPTVVTLRYFLSQLQIITVYNNKTQYSDVNVTKVTWKQQVFPFWVLMFIQLNTTKMSITFATSHNASDPVRTINILLTHSYTKYPTITIINSRDKNCKYIPSLKLMGVSSLAPLKSAY